jgi:hypothetical protein
MSTTEPILPRLLRAAIPARRRARRGEAFISSYEFPPSVRSRFEKDAPGIEWGPVESGLREWLICCAYRRRRPLGMPSRAVDYAWHAFILDTAAYRAFCERAYGRFLDHIPETAMTENARGDYETVWAWDRSRASTVTDSALWNLDESLDIEEPLCISAKDVVAARTRGSSRPLGLVPFDLGGGCASGGCAGGGCGGGGCGGGGCGGGGCGGG